MNRNLNGRTRLAGLRVVLMMGPMLIAAGCQALPDKIVAQRDVWIGVRIDGRDGAGTQLDPLDGSTQEKFDALLAGYRQTGVTNMTIHLWPGTYVTKGDAAWTLFTGWRIAGSGVSETTIRLAGLTKEDTTVISGEGDGRQEVCDLTVDGNYSGLPWSRGLHSIAGLRLKGPDTKIRRVRVLNTGGDTGAFAIMGVADPADNCAIEGCVVEKPATTFENATGISIGSAVRGKRALSKGSRLLSNAVSGCLRGYTAFGMDGLLAANNRATGCGYGWYQASPVQTNVVIAHNEFLGCRYGGIVMGEAMRESDTEHVEILGNTIEVEPNAVALGLFNRVIADVAFRFNRVKTSGWAKAASVCASAGKVVLENNVIDPGMYMDIRAKTVTWRGNRSPDGIELHGLEDARLPGSPERLGRNLTPLAPAMDPQEPPGAVAPLEAALGKNGAIANWLILGPFPHPARPFPGPGEAKGGPGYDFDFLFNTSGAPGQGEATAKARTGASVKVVFPTGPDATLLWTDGQRKTRRIAWQRVHAHDENGTVDVTRIPNMGPDLDNTCIYAVCHLKAAADTPARLKVASDDGYVLFVNGKRIAEARDDRRDFVPDMDSIDFDLRAGENAIVFKLCNGVGGFGMRLRLTDRKDQPAKGITVVLP